MSKHEITQSAFVTQMGYDPSQSVVDPVGVVEAASRTFRGGAYDMVARSLRAAARYGGSASTRNPNRGFRVVRTSP